MPIIKMTTTVSDYKNQLNSFNPAKWTKKSLSDQENGVRFSRQISGVERFFSLIAYSILYAITGGQNARIRSELSDSWKGKRITIIKCTDPQAISVTKLFFEKNSNSSSSQGNLADIDVLPKEQLSFIKTFGSRKLTEENQKKIKELASEELNRLIPYFYEVHYNSLELSQIAQIDFAAMPEELGKRACTNLFNIRYKPLAEQCLKQLNEKQLNATAIKTFFNSNPICLSKLNISQLNLITSDSLNEAIWNIIESLKEAALGVNDKPSVVNIVVSEISNQMTKKEFINKFGQAPLTDGQAQAIKNLNAQDLNSLLHHFDQIHFNALTALQISLIDFSSEERQELFSEIVTNSITSTVNTKALTSTQLNQLKGKLDRFNILKLEIHQLTSITKIGTTDEQWGLINDRIKEETLKKSSIE